MDKKITCPILMDKKIACPILIDKKITYPILMEKKITCLIPMDKKNHLSNPNGSSPSARSVSSCCQGYTSVLINLNSNI
jgi:hypothetical protein